MEEIAGCVQKFRDLSCSDIGLGLSRACARSGKRALDQHCAFPAQCQSGVCTGGIGSCGSCEAQAKHIGDTCTTLTPCPTGAFCHPVTNKCTDAIMYGGEGAACNTKSDPILACEKDLPCILDEGGTSGTCRRPGVEGEPCPIDAFTLSHRCTIPLECRLEHVVYTCLGPPKCGATVCDENSYCATVDGSQSCAPKAMLGEACGVELVCVAPVQCTRVASDGGAQCLKPEIGLLGEPCNPSGCLTPYACRDQKCVVYPAAGCPP